MTQPNDQGGGLRVNPAYLDQGDDINCRLYTHSSNNSAEYEQRRQYYSDNKDRRHTLGSHVPGVDQKQKLTNEQKRELFMEYLKQKYPDHSNTIEAAKTPDKETFSNGFFDDDGTMSEIDTQATGFQRGGRSRASLPMSKSIVNKSKEKPLGLVYLNYMNETKRALMPNEITGIDTVKALFVRAFPQKLNMAMLDLPQRKIYIQDPITEIFYELEKLHEVKDRVILKIYEQGFVEDTTLINIRSSTSTPIDLNICADSELVDVDLPDFRERNYCTVSGSKPAKGRPNRFEPLHPQGPNSTTQMDMGNRRSILQQPCDRASTNVPLRSSPSKDPFQRGTLERATAPVRPLTTSTPLQPLYPRGSPMHLTSTTLPRQQQDSGQLTPTNISRSMTMPRANEKGQIYRPHPDHGGRPHPNHPGRLHPEHGGRPHPDHARPHPDHAGRSMERTPSGERRVQCAVQTPAMSPGPASHRPSRTPNSESQWSRDNYHPDYQIPPSPRASTPQPQGRSIGSPRGGPYQPRGAPSQGRDPASPKSVPGSPMAGPPQPRDSSSPRRQPPQDGSGGGSPVKAPRGEIRSGGQHPRQLPPSAEMQGRPPSRNSGPGMRQPPPNHQQGSGRPVDRPRDRSMDRHRDRSMDRPHDRSVERLRDRSMDRPRSTPPPQQRIDPRGGPPSQGASPMRQPHPQDGRHPHPQDARHPHSQNGRQIVANVIKQGPIQAQPSSDTSVRISAMEEQIASLAGMVRSALKTEDQASPEHQQQRVLHADSSHDQSPCRNKSELTGYNEEVIRASQNQQAFTVIDSGQSEGVDSTSVTPQPMSSVISQELHLTTRTLKHTVKDLRDQLKQIRKLQLNMVQDMNVAFRATNRKVQLALEATPAGNEHPVRSLRTRTHQDYMRYHMSRDRLDKDIRDMESSVEEMRDDVINKHCNVNLSEVDALAQSIGNSSKHIAEQKVAFPMLADKMKAVMQAEMEVVVTEEAFIKEEPGRLDDYMKRCKKVTGTLCTLKRLAYVQEHRTPVVPIFEQTTEKVNREALMETIQQISPNHAERVKNLQAADKSRQRRRHFKTSQELHRFQMDLGKGRQSLNKTNNAERIEQQRRAVLKELFKTEEHDTMTPIVTSEKMAKQQAKRKAPPPPPKRTHFSQRVTISQSSGAPSEGTHAPTPVLVVSSPAAGSNGVDLPAIPPKPAVMTTMSAVASPDGNQQVDASPARSAADLNCMNSCQNVFSVSSECLSGPGQVSLPSAHLPSGFKSEPLLVSSEYASMPNNNNSINDPSEVRKPSLSYSQQHSSILQGTIMTSQSAPMRSPNDGQAGQKLSPTSPHGGVTSPRGVVTPEGGIMLSHGAVMIAKSGLATSPGLVTTPQRQGPVRLLSSGLRQKSPTKTKSPTSSQQQSKPSSIPVLKNFTHSSSKQGSHSTIQVIRTSKPLQSSLPQEEQIKRRSSVPSSMDIIPPPKPPRGCVEEPSNTRDNPPKSAFRPLPIPGWTQTSLDNLPPRKKSSSSVDKQRRHTVTLPQHQRRNGWIGGPPAAFGGAASSLTPSSSPKRQISLMSPPQTFTRSPEMSPPKSSTDVSTPNTLTTLKKDSLPKSGTDSQLCSEKKSTLQRQNSDPGTRPELSTFDQKGALKIKQLKEQYAKLRQLQEDQRRMEKKSSDCTSKQSEIPKQHPEKEGTPTDMKASTLTSPALEIDISYSEGETSKTEDQDEASTYTKQTVVYKVGSHPIKMGDPTLSSALSPSTNLDVAKHGTKKEIIADSIPVTNGMVQQAVYSQSKTHEMAPRSFATKAKAGVLQSCSTSRKLNNQNDKVNNVDNTSIINNKNDGTKPLTNGEEEILKVRDEQGTTGTAVEKMNNLNGGSHDNKPETKAVYTKRLEETFIF